MIQRSPLYPTSLRTRPGMRPGRHAGGRPREARETQRTNVPAMPQIAGVGMRACSYHASPGKSELLFRQLPQDLRINSANISPGHAGQIAGQPDCPATMALLRAPHRYPRLVKLPDVTGKARRVAACRCRVLRSHHSHRPGCDQARHLLARSLRFRHVRADDGQPRRARGPPLGASQCVAAIPAHVGASGAAIGHQLTGRQADATHPARPDLGRFPPNRDGGCRLAMTSSPRSPAARAVVSARNVGLPSVVVRPASRSSTGSPTLMHTLPLHVGERRIATGIPAAGAGIRFRSLTVLTSDHRSVNEW